MKLSQKKLIWSHLRKLGFYSKAEQQACLNKYFKNGDLDYFDNLRAASPPENHGQIRQKEHTAFQNVLNLPVSKKTERINKDTWLTASEIASYVYCPVSFSIKRTYRITAENKEMEMGTFLHDAIQSQDGGLMKNTSSIIKQKKKELPALYEHKLGYAGHLKKADVFVNKDLEITCKPDLIFQSNDDSGWFIIEEKYSPSKALVENVYPNQKIQIQAYLETIPNASYGYVVTWYYFFSDKGELKFQHSLALDKLSNYKISKPDEKLSSKLRQTVDEIRSLLSKGWITRKVSSSAKCIPCTLKQHCLHFKIDNLKGIKFPYK